LIFFSDNYGLFIVFTTTLTMMLKKLSVFFQSNI